MNAAVAALRDAEDTLVDIRRYSHLYQPINGQPCDEEQAEAFELAHPGICM